MIRADVALLLVSGLHANEVCAPILAAMVYHRLVALGVGVAWEQIPDALTLLGLLDDPATADARFSQREETQQLDMDLDGLDDVLRIEYPNALVFEFHNAPDTHRLLNIDPAKPIENYELGTVAPDFVRPYEIGTWRNIDTQGQPTKFLIELPACYRPTDRDRLDHRRAELRRLIAAGYGFPDHLLVYLEQEADLEASRQRGYLDDLLAQKVAAWIIHCRAQE